jgi:2-furoyl-CoA dehydrogenase large subunit
MDVKGERHLDARPEAVFAAICDPRVLLSVIPGCKAVEQTAPNEFSGLIQFRLPGMAGHFTSVVRLVDAHPPVSSGLEGRLEGVLGSIAGRADFQLVGTPSGTNIQYKGHAVMDGPLSRLDSRFAERLAETLIGQGLEALDAQLRVGAAR